MIEYLNPQGSLEWHDARRGVLTASAFRVARSRNRNGEFTNAAHRLAMNLAREQLGGVTPEGFQNDAMRLGSEQEAYALAAYENERFEFPQKVGLFTTDDRLLGCSPDGLINTDGGIEVKTMVGTETLMRAYVNEDISEYKDQCIGGMLLLNRKWWDLCLWWHEMEKLKVIRIARDEAEIQALNSDLHEFMQIVNHYKTKLDPASQPNHNGHVLLSTVEMKCHD